ncbi:MAG TPA: AMP-binding protein [Bacteroidales bacterium]|nr:AMP-binding protein [Bacteroidales bacterium]HPS15611.1 AMP-binding protein [Bacteroidales bacterium]
MQAITNLFEESVKKFGKNAYLYEKKDDTYQYLTYKEVHQIVYQLASGLLNIGVKKGDRISVISEGRNDWVISELAILYAGAINVPLSVKLTEPSELEFRLKHSEAHYIISSVSQLKKIREIKAKLNLVEKIIVLDALEKYEDKEIFSGDVIKAGDEFLKTNLKDFNERWQSVKGDDIANICYTSGTTAEPKGIMLSHRNYTANAEQSLSLMDVPEYYTSLLILPWDHAFAHAVGIYSIMKAGASIASVQLGSSPIETLKNIPINIKEIRPHFLLSVPSLAKNFKKNIETGIAAKGKFIQKLFNKGIKLAYYYNGMSSFEKGKGKRIFLKPILKLFDIIIFKKIRKNFGGRLHYFIGGGALLDTEIQKFFYAIGIPMFQGYGLTEASPVISSNSERKHKIGSSGYLVSNLKLKICDTKGNELPAEEKGEIVIQGENVMTGYWKNPEATAETIRNGWLYTGDLGYIDKDGFLFVYGRFKSLLIADDGEKYSPEGIEEAFIGQSQYIDQCMLYNNQNPYSVCLIAPNVTNLKKWIEENGLRFDSNETVIKALKLIENEISLYRKGNKFDGVFPQRWLPSAIGIISEAFTEENHMMNSTLKIVRGKIIEHYKPTIDFLYMPEAKDICNSKNIYAMKEIFRNFNL